jgi:hypothetical protein
MIDGTAEVVAEAELPPTPGAVEEAVASSTPAAEEPPTPGAVAEPNFSSTPFADEPPTPAAVEDPVSPTLVVASAELSPIPAAVTLARTSITPSDVL